MNAQITTRFAALLRWVEHFGLKLDYNQLKKRYRGKGDGWWLANAEGEMTGPFLFEEILERLLDGEAAAAPAYIVHESVASEDPTPWRAVQHHPLWTQPKAVNWFRRGVIAFAILVAWMILRDLGPLRGEIAGTCLDILFLIGILWLLWREYRERLQRIFPFLRSRKSEHQSEEEERDNLGNPGIGMSAEKSFGQKTAPKSPAETDAHSIPGNASDQPPGSARDSRALEGDSPSSPKPNSGIQPDKPSQKQWRKPDLTSEKAGRSAPPLPSFQPIPQEFIPLRNVKSRRGFGKPLMAIVLLVVAGVFVANHYHLLPPAAAARGQSAWNTLYAKGTEYCAAAKTKVGSFSSSKAGTKATAENPPIKVNPQERLAALVNHPSQWPKTVHLTKSETFPAIIQGKAAGSVEAHPGTAVRVMAVSETAVTVNYLGAQKELPVEETDLLKAATSPETSNPTPAASQPNKPQKRATESHAKSGTENPQITQMNADSKMRRGTANPRIVRASSRLEDASSSNSETYFGSREQSPSETNR